MARDAFEYDVGGELRDRYGRKQLMVVSKHAAPLSSDTTRGYTAADADGRDQIVLVGADGNDYMATRGVSVKDFPFLAKGDSVTDDTAALNAAYSLGADVYMPPGTYRTTSNLVLAGNTHLRGAGPGLTVIRRDATTATVNVITNQHASVGGGDTDILIENLTVQRQGAATAPNDQADRCISLVGVVRATVRGVRTIGSAKAIVMQGCNQFQITNNYIAAFVDNAINAASLAGAVAGDGIIADNVIGVATGATASSGIICTADHVLIAHNHFTDAVTNIIETGTHYDGTTHTAFVTIMGNVARWSGAGSVANTILIHETDDVLIEGNVIHNGNIYLATNGATNNLRADVIDNTINVGELIADRVTSASLTGNRITNAATHGLDIKTASLDVLAQGNSVSLSGTDGIYVQGTRATLIGNRCFDNGVNLTAGNRYGIVLDGATSPTLIANRAYDSGSGNQTHGLYINASTGVIDMLNDFVGNVTAERATYTNSPTFGAFPVAQGLRVREGTNAKQGVATLAAGTVVVSNTSVTASSRIQLTAQDNNTTGALRVSARTAGTSFTILSSNAGDTGVVAYQIFEPG